MFGNIIAVCVLIIFVFIQLVTSVFTGVNGGGQHVNADANADTDTYVGGAALNRDQREVGRKYRRYADEDPPAFRKFCYPTTYKVQRRQAFIGEWMDPSNGVRECLAYYSIGAGKTCAAIQVAERYRRPLVILPASLIGGFRNELRSPCAGNTYCTAAWREELATLPPRSARYREIIAESDALIDAKYTIMSYNKFAEDGAPGRHDVIIIDEVHNLANADGTFYGAALAWINSHPRTSVLLMSATPIFDSPAELNGLARLLRADVGGSASNASARSKATDTGSILTPDDVMRVFAGRVSYFAGAPSWTFPTADIRKVKLRMSPHQSRWYHADIVNELTQRGTVREASASTSFYSTARQRANVAFPRGLAGDDGLRALTAADIRERIGVYSCKMAHLRRKLRKNKLAFVYTAYTGAAGIDLIVRCLQTWGWRDYFTDGPGRGRFAVWSGDTSDARRDEIRSVYNRADNDDASQIAVVIGSPAIREGVSLLRVRSAHLIDLYWNMPRIDQIVGRVIRFCSHKTLPAAERNVRVYMYMAYAARSPTTSALPDAADPDVSIDAYMLGLAEEKKMENAPYITALQEIAIDRALNA